MKGRRRWKVRLGLISVAIISLDWLLGPFILIPLTFVVPVSLAAWYLERRAGILLACVLPLFRACFVLFHWKSPVATLAVGAVNLLILTTVLIGMAWFMALAAESVRLAKRVHTLEGMLSICGFCKKIQTESGQWEQLESYITHHSDTQFSHSLCPGCAAKEFPEVFNAE
jgi:hypothetical protein